MKSILHKLCNFQSVFQIGFLRLRFDFLGTRFALIVRSDIMSWDQTTLLMPRSSGTAAGQKILEL